MRRGSYADTGRRSANFRTFASTRSLPQVVAGVAARVLLQVVLVVVLGERERPGLHDLRHDRSGPAPARVDTLLDLLGDGTLLLGRHEDGRAVLSPDVVA